MDLPVKPPVSPMLAKLARELPPANGYLWEPKWDGFRCIVFRDGDEVELGSRNERPLTRYFPELVESLRRELPARCVVDGEIVITGPNGLDFEALLQRIHPAESRITLLARETPASFVAFDILALGDEDLRGLPFEERRAKLEEALANVRPPVHVTPITDDRDVAADWFRRFEGAGLDGVIAKPLGLKYVEGKREMIKVKHQRTADCVVGGFRWHKDGEGVGSLLLGLYDEHGKLHHVGVATGLSAALRKKLVTEVVPGPFQVAVELQGRARRGRVETVAIAPAARANGRVVVAGDHSIEIFPAGDGKVGAVVLDAHGQPVAARAGLTLTVNVGTRPVELTWNAEQEKWIGDIEAETELDVNATPVEVVLVANGRRRHGRFGRGLALGHARAAAAAQVDVQPPGANVRLNAPGAALRVQGREGLVEVGGAGGVRVRGPGGNVQVGGGNIRVQGPGGNVSVMGAVEARAAAAEARAEAAAARQQAAEARREAAEARRRAAEARGQASGSVMGGISIMGGGGIQIGQ